MLIAASFDSFSGQGKNWSFERWGGSLCCSFFYACESVSTMMLSSNVHRCGALLLRRYGGTCKSYLHGDRGVNSLFSARAKCPQRCLTNKSYLHGDKGGNSLFSPRAKCPKRCLTTNTPRRDVERIVRVAKKDDATTSNATKTSFFERFLGPKPMPERYSFAWYKEVALICTVFGITGSSTMILVRPAVKDVLGIQGSFRDGPWSYRICSIVIMSPIYATLLVAVGTVFGRHAYFRHFSVKIFSRFGIPPELMDKNWKVNQQNFKKW